MGKQKKKLSKGGSSPVFNFKKRIGASPLFLSRNFIVWNISTSSSADYSLFSSSSGNMTATIDGFFRTFNTKLEAPVRSHLKNVYTSLTMSVLSAAAGAYVHLFTSLLSGGGIVFSLLGFGLAMGLHFTPDNGKNRGQRLAMLLGMAIRINPAIIPNALLLSTVIFASFSGAALFAPDGQYLFLGGTLLSGLSGLFWMGLANIFFQSQMLFQLHMWLSLFLFCGFIMWDTQMIILKKRRGDGDFIAHSLDLFIDFIQIVRHIIVLLMQKEERDDRNKKRKN